MAKYRFTTTDITTGQPLGTDLPINGQNASMQISGIGSFGGTLQLLTEDTSAVIRAANVAAVEPWKSVLWVLQNNAPIWAGPVTGWQPSSAMDGNLAFQASTMESLLQYRLLRDQAVQYSVVAGSGTSPRTAIQVASPQIASFLPVTIDDSGNSTSTGTYLVYDVVSGTDVFDLVRAVVNYAVNKPITDPSNNTLAIPSAAVKVASLIFSTTNESGITIQNTGDVKIDPAQGQSCYDFINSLASTYGFEWCIQPGLTSSGSLAMTLTLGAPTLGRLFTDTGFQFNYPSYTTIDYVWTRQAQNPTNAVYSTGSSADNSNTAISQYPYGFDTDELSQGYALLEQVGTMPTPASENDTTAQNQVNAYAAGQVLNQSVLGQLTPSVLLGPDAYPTLSQIQVGDQAMLTATSQLHPADQNTGAPGLQVLTRITSWNLTFPGTNSTETNQVYLADISQVVA